MSQGRLFKNINLSTSIHLSDKTDIDVIRLVEGELIINNLTDTIIDWEINLSWKRTYSNREWDTSNANLKSFHKKFRSHYKLDGVNEISPDVSVSFKIHKAYSYAIEKVKGICWDGYNRSYMKPENYPKEIWQVNGYRKLRGCAQKAKNANVEFIGAVNKDNFNVKNKQKNVTFNRHFTILEILHFENEIACEEL